MNRREPNNRDPRRGLPNAAERQKTNVPLKNNERTPGEREAVELPNSALDENLCFSSKRIIFQSLAALNGIAKDLRPSAPAKAKLDGRHT